jgi:hypothetical protein
LEYFEKGYFLIGDGKEELALHHNWTAQLQISHATCAKAIIALYRQSIRNCKQE